MALTPAQIFAANYSYQGPIPGTSVDFDPLAAFDWKAAFYAGDPLWTPPADGGAVAAWKNGGTTRSEGAYLSTSAGLTLPGTAGNYASVPDEAALDITGDIDIRVKVALDDWSALQVLADKWPGTTGYQFRVHNTSGAMLFAWGDGSSNTATSTAGNGITDGETSWVRVTLDVDNGAGGYDVNFYKSTDGESWTQIGSTVTGGSTTSITANTTALGIGATTAGVTPATGDLHQVQVYNGIAGSKVLDVDFQRADTNKFTATSGQTVTVHNTRDASQATGSKQPAYRASVAALNDKPAVQGDGVDDFLQTAAWSSALAQPSSIVAVASGVTNGRHIWDGIAAGNRQTVYVSGGNWTILAGSAVAGSAADTDPHLFVAHFTGTDTLDVDGAEVVSGAAGAHTLTGLTLLANYLGSSNDPGHIAFIGAIAGDITAEANWAAFVAWVESEYGIAVA